MDWDDIATQTGWAVLGMIVAKRRCGWHTNAGAMGYFHPMNIGTALFVDLMNEEHDKEAEARLDRVYEELGPIVMKLYEMDMIESGVGRAPDGPA